MGRGRAVNFLGPDPAVARLKRGECPRCSAKLLVEATESRLELASCPRKLCGYAVWRVR